MFQSQAKTVEIFINDKSYQVDPKLTIFQACHQNGIVIPRFCFHEKLAVAGNCRMCLVEVERAPKPVAACAAQVSPGMKIRTESEKTKIARGGVMEFLLANHPLDCPICDQGGECDLQDISQNYGYETGRYMEFKRAVEDKNVGPLIQTIMNRCIHCTRCVRFAKEVGGFFDLGTCGRGKATEIGTYVEKMIGSELSGNLVDLCPVGALTNAPYAFTSRPWELQRTNSVDLMEAICPAVEYDSRGTEIMRSLPRIHNEVNEEWISDKSRYSYDGLKRQRLAFPMLKNKETGMLEEIKWQQVMSIIRDKFTQANLEQDMVGLVGEFCSLEGLTAFKDLFQKLNCDNFAYTPYPIKGFQREDYLMNRTILEFEELDHLILIGCNLKLQSPVLNARVLKAIRRNGLQVHKIGPAEDLTYNYNHLGNTTQVINDIISGKHEICKVLKESKNYHILIGGGMTETNPNINNIHKAMKMYVENLSQQQQNNGSVGVIHQFVGPINAYELGMNFKSIDEIKDKKIIFNFGNDNEKLNELLFQNKKQFVVYLGSHGDIGARNADLVLPSCAWTEQRSTYMNVEGRVQFAQKVVNPPAMAHEEWMVFVAMAEELGINLNYDNKEEIRYRIAELSPSCLKYDFVESYFVYQRGEKLKKLDSEIICSNIDNYYKTDVVSKSSFVLNKCSAAFNKRKLNNFLSSPLFN